MPGKMDMWTGIVNSRNVSERDTGEGRTSQKIKNNSEIVYSSSVQSQLSESGDQSHFPALAWEGYHS
jgi:hypothetical protein